MRIELVSAATNPRETRAYYEGLGHCYARFSADNAAQGRAQVDRRAGLFFAMARQRGKVLGGCGIHVRNGNGSLPVERALDTCELLRQKLDYGRHVAELSGLWVKDELRGSGVSLRLMQCAMAALPLLEVTIGIGFSHQHVLPLYAQIGLFPDPELSNFAYPDRRYASSVLWADAVGLTGVTPENQAAILKAREAFAAGNKLPVRFEPIAPRLSRVPPPRTSLAPMAPAAVRGSIAPRASSAPRAAATPRTSVAPPRASVAPRTTVAPRAAAAPRAAIFPAAMHPRVASPS
jgi:hypothetical protein